MGGGPFIQGEFRNAFNGSKDEGSRVGQGRAQHYAHVSLAPSIHSVRWVFPSTAGSQPYPSGPSVRVTERLTAPSLSPRHRHMSRRSYPLARPSPYSRADSVRRLTRRPLAPGRLCLPAHLRYYGLIRRSLALRLASPHDYSARSLPAQGCASHLPFFAPTDLLDVPPPLPRRSSRRRESEPSPNGLRFGLRSVPLQSGSRGPFSRGSSVHLMLRPAVLLGPLARPRAAASQKSALVLVRLRQSLPGARSPSLRVCYDYSVPLPLPRRDLHPLACQRSRNDLAQFLPRGGMRMALLLPKAKRDQFT